MSIFDKRLNTSQVLAAKDTSPSQIPRARHSFISRVRHLLVSDYFILYLTIIFFIVASYFFPTLSSPGNISNQFQNMWPLLAVAIGQTFVLILGGIDLSVGATMGITSVIGAIIMAETLDPAFFDKSPLWGSLMTEAGGVLHGSTWAVPIGVLSMLLAGILIGS